MKQYMIFLLLVLIISCAPTVEVDRAKPVEDVQEPEEVIEEPEILLQEEPEEVIEEENIIEIREDGFYPKEKIVEKNTVIKWVKKDTRDYRITCYLEGTRVIQSPDLKYGDSFTHVFLKEGEYTCITVPYGLRNIITVKAQKALLSPTGGVVASESKNIKETVFASTAISTAVVVFSSFIYFNRRGGL